MSSAVMAGTGAAGVAGGGAGAGAAGVAGAGAPEGAPSAPVAGAPGAVGAGAPAGGADAGTPAGGGEPGVPAPLVVVMMFLLVLRRCRKSNSPFREAHHAPREKSSQFFFQDKRT